jgi:hypothetical protein
LLLLLLLFINLLKVAAASANIKAVTATTTVITMTIDKATILLDGCFPPLFTSTNDSLVSGFHLVNQSAMNQ